MIAAGLDEQVRALREGRAFVRPSARTVAVTGADAPGWLNDLVTAGVETLGVGASVRSLLLSPTGHVRADLIVLRTPDAHLIVQTDDQPEAIDDILSPFILSSAVEVRATTAAPVLLAVDGAWIARLEPPEDAVEVSRDAAEAWRIAEGIAVFPVDLDAGSIPAEAGLDVPPVTDVGKGCFLGQESVARVRNLGRPPRTIVAVRSEGAVAAGESVETRGGAAGIVTSAAPDPDGEGSIAIVRIRWDMRGERLSTSRGATLRRS